MDEYKIRLAAFEGPLALLMHLIDKNKIDIYDIPIAELTRQYMEYLDGFREFNIEVASSFLVMAATLLQIKSRLMLPRQPKEDGEGEDEEEDDLVRRLLEYKQFRQVSEVLSEMASFQEKFFAREPLAVPTTHVPPKDLPLNLLVRAFKNALKLQRELTVPEVIVRAEEFSIKDKMREIMQILDNENGKILFSALFTRPTRAELIALFLALLELIKLKKVRCRQDEQFADIGIYAIASA